MRLSLQVVNACHGEACSHTWSAAACNTASRSCSGSSPRVARIGRGGTSGIMCFLPFVCTAVKARCVIVADCVAGCTFLDGPGIDCGGGNCFDRGLTLLYSTLSRPT